MLSNNYYFLLKEYLSKKRIYDRLDLEEKIEFMNLELRLNGISIKDIGVRFHTKSEAKTNKKVKAERLKIKSESGL